MKGKNGLETVYFKEIDSTNDYVKIRRGEGKDLLAVAKKQTGGRGTKGRSFQSEKGGVYLSLLRFYEDFPAREAFKIMAGAATAVCEVLEDCGLSPVIKWPNDIHVNGKKICGILIENAFGLDKVTSSVVGIGLNVYNELDEELAFIATTIKRETGKRFSVHKLAKKLAWLLYRETDLCAYQKRLGYMGGAATLLLGDERIPATLVSVDEEGNLLALAGGELRRFAAAEVSLRV